MHIKRIGIIGYGQFGRMLYRHLAPHFEVRIYDADGTGDLTKACDTDLVIFAVPAQALAAAAEAAQHHIDPETIITDVTSVKVKSMQLLSEVFPNNPLLGTHPIFGPQTEAKLGSIVGLPIVLTNHSLSDEIYSAIANFLTNHAQLTVIEKTAEEHDKEMAEVLALSHFIGRALSKMDLHRHLASTHGYHQLLNLRDIVAPDSWELFKTVQEENPYARELRLKFIKELETLEEQLEA